MKIIIYFLSIVILLLSRNSFSQSDRNKIPEGFTQSQLNSFTDKSGKPLFSKNTVNDDTLETDAMQERFFTGAVAGDRFGNSVASAGDVNGDGYPDIIIGAPANDAGGTSAGRAYIYFGGMIINSAVDVILTGAAANDYFGISVSSAGDVNGDGYGDVIVGADSNDAGGSNAGRAYIFFGGAVMNNTADVILTGALANDFFGFSVAAAGDVNQDGFSDVVAGAPGNDATGSLCGRAYIYFGGASMDNIADVTLTGEGASNFLGNSVSTAEDVNNDGYSDVLIAAKGNSAGGLGAGRTYIYFGGASMNSTADVILTGFAIGDAFGNSVASCGDINGDGNSDVIIGAATSDASGADAGRVYVFFGGVAMDNIVDVTFTGAFPGDNFGTSVSKAGDVNGDGYGDVIIGAPGYDAIGLGSGRSYVFFGGVSPDNVADAVQTGAQTTDQFGTALSYAGDINRDGYGDILVGALFNSAGGLNAGRAYLYLNSMTGTDISDEFFTGIANDNLGFSVSSAGDVNGDGFNDLIVGANLNSAGGSNAGRAYIYFGGIFLNNSPDVTITGSAAGDQLGVSVSSAGDVNADGYGDVIVGAVFSDSGGSNSGRAYVFFGSPSMDNIADVTMTGLAADDFLGTSVSSAGDVNGDGYSDVIVGAPGNADGKSYIYFGGIAMNNTLDITLTSQSTGEHFGASVSTAGDFNGDGYSDVIIGADSASLPTTNAGRAYIFFGGNPMIPSVDVTISGEASGDLLGISVSTAGDVNGDGYTDVVVGAYGNDAGGNNSGRTYIYFGGASVNNIADVTLTGAAIDDQFGISVSTAGDVNGDGYSDIITGANLNDVGGSNAGRAYIYFGGALMNNEADITVTGAATADNLGRSVSGAGDMNNDGYGDVIVGSHLNDAGGSSAGRAYLYLSSSPSVIPGLLSVKDVPFDQGSFVKLKWSRCGYDVPGNNSITGYIIEQSPPPGISGFAWSPVVTIPAVHNSFYSYNVHTDNDSLTNNSGVMFYRINAQSPSENLRSNIMSGYSVDNLAPFAPQSLAAIPDNNSINLTWNENHEADLHHYIIYRNGTPLFTSVNNNFDDATALEDSTYQYQIGAVDIHGNISPFSNLVSLTFNNSGSLGLTIIMEGFYDGASHNMRISDTATVYLRNSSAPYSIVDSSKSVIDANTFTGSFQISNASTGTYYIQIRHRNTIETWSGSTIHYTQNENVEYDFTTSDSQAFGNNMTKVEEDVFGIFSGDINHDGTVNLSDIILTSNNSSSFINGYVDTDLTGDNVTNLSDILIAFNNSSTFVHKITP